MAQQTTDQRILALIVKRDRIEAVIAEQERYAEMEGQGSEGARTKFTDPRVLYSRIDFYENKIANLRLRSDATE